MKITIIPLKYFEVTYHNVVVILPKNAEIFEDEKSQAVIYVEYGDS